MMSTGLIPTDLVIDLLIRYGFKVLGAIVILAAGLHAHDRGRITAVQFCTGLGYFAREFDIVDLVVKRVNRIAVA